MVKELYCCYQSFRVVNPNWPKRKVILHCFFSVRALLYHKRDSVYFSVFKKINKKIVIKNKEILDDIYKTSGVVFITIHADSYPLLGKIYHDFFGKRSLVVPYLFNSKLPFVSRLKRKFAEYGVQIVGLGGAMTVVDKVLSSGGSVCLFLDAELSVNHRQAVTLFNREIRMSTGSHFLAKKYNMPIVPVYIKSSKKIITLNIQKPILVGNGNQETVMQKVANALEELIRSNLKSWQTFDRFLLNPNQQQS